MKIKFFILCDVIFLVRLQRKFEIGGERVKFIVIRLVYQYFFRYCNKANHETK